MMKLRLFFLLAAPLLATATPPATLPAHAQSDDGYSGETTRWPRLQRGSSGANVRALQGLLLARGVRVSADGRFGTQTVAAVKRFQRARGLAADGIVGRQTWEALTPTLRNGSRGASVRVLQTLLRARYKVRVDGVFGDQTQAAVEATQRDAPVAQDVTGVADDGVWCILVGGYLLGE